MAGREEVPLDQEVYDATLAAELAKGTDRRVADGRAKSADLNHSSGYRRLDAAATRSAVENWVFDVSACERKDLPVTHVVAVEYHNDSY